MGGWGGGGQLQSKSAVNISWTPHGWPFTPQRSLWKFIQFYIKSSQLTADIKRCSSDALDTAIDCFKSDKKFNITDLFESHQYKPENIFHLIKIYTGKELVNLTQWQNQMWSKLFNYATGEFTRWLFWQVYPYKEFQKMVLMLFKDI